MNLLLVHSWWSLVIRGLLAILVGILTFAWPGITLAALVLLFGAYALIDGVVSIVGAWRAAEARERWGSLLIEGIAGIIAAIVTIVWPAITALALVYIIAAWAIVTGALEITAAVRLRKYISGEWLLALMGVCSVLFGALLVIFPLVGAITIALWFGVYCFVFGCLLVALGMRLRSFVRTFNMRSPMSAPSR